MNINTIVLASIISIGSTGAAQAGQVVSADKSIATNLCVTAATGNRAAMHNTIKASGYSAKFIASKIECNGENLLSFVENNGQNSASMLKMLDRTKTSVSITDIAKVTIEDK